MAIVLGPLGLFVWLIAGRKPNPRPWQAALVEAAGHLPPVVVAYLVMLGVFILFPQAQANQLLQLLFIIILPVLLGWLFFQGPLLALAGRRGYLRTLGQRLPAAWVGANLGMGGVTAIAIPLANWLSSTCSVMDPSIWLVVSIWAVVAVGAALGMLIVLLYEGWAVRHGYRCLERPICWQGRGEHPRLAQAVVVALAELWRCDWWGRCRQFDPTNEINEHR